MRNSTLEDGEYTCTCVSWNENTHEFDEAPECWGDCQEETESVDEE